MLKEKVALTLQVNQFQCPIVDITHDDLCAASVDTRWTLMVGQDGFDELKVIGRVAHPNNDSTHYQELVVCTRHYVSDTGSYNSVQVYDTRSGKWLKDNEEENG